MLDSSPEKLKFNSSSEKVAEIVGKFPCEEISIEITEECNCKCIHCSSDAGKAWEDELSMEEIKEIIRTGEEHLGTKVISLSGGDPILRKDFVDIVKYIDSLDLDILVYSSGVAGEGGVFKPFINTETFSDIVEIMRNRPGNKMIYSLEGGSKFSHEFITRTRKSWEYVLKCIEITVVSGIFCEVHTCPMTTNMNELHDIYNLLIGLGVSRWSLLRIVPQGRCSAVEYLIPNKVEFRSILKRLEILMDDSFDRTSRGVFSPEIRVGDPLNFYACMDALPIMPIATCSAAKDRILIRANGEAQFCAALKHNASYDYGNCRKTNLVDLWVDSDMANILRRFHEDGYKKIGGQCSECGNLEICRGGCVSQRIATYGDINIGPDPLCTFFRVKD